VVPELLLRLPPPDPVEGEGVQLLRDCDPPELKLLPLLLLLPLSQVPHEEERPELLEPAALPLLLVPLHVVQPERTGAVFCLLTFERHPLS
jgi:hypothetical protein